PHILVKEDPGRTRGHDRRNQYGCCNRAEVRTGRAPEDQHKMRLIALLRKVNDHCRLARVISDLNRLAMPRRVCQKKENSRTVRLISSTSTCNVCLCICNVCLRCSFCVFRFSIFSSMVLSLAPSTAIGDKFLFSPNHRPRTRSFTRRSCQTRW